VRRVASGCARLLPVVAALHCAGPGFDLADAPDSPIAIVHRTREESDRRAELMERLEGKAPQSTLERMRIQDLGEWVGLGADPAQRQLALVGHLALLAPRTGAVQRVDAALGGARPLCWSPDRTRLLFLGTGRGQEPQLHEYRPGSGEVRAVTYGPTAHPGGCYGPGDRQVWVEVRPGAKGPEARLVLAPEEGGGEPRVLTEGPADVSPVWSPRGDLIAFQTRDADGAAAIAVVDPQGGPPRVIARGKEPGFAPSGDWIVYSGQQRGRWRLWRMRPDGSGKLVLGTGTLDEHEPAVSPDGRFVVFVGREKDSTRERLYLRGFDGRGDRPLLEREEGAQPAW
jgi:dipeptidyl aminopeptidase/acylaminoacyl peptidase